MAMAVALVGSADRVRIRMQCSESDYAAYSAGLKEPSSPELNRLVDLIVDEQSRAVQANREAIRRVRQKLAPRKDS